MPVLLDMPPPPSAEARPIWGPGDTPEAQGLEGQQIQAQLADVLLHWRGLPTANGTHTASAEDDNATYAHVPLETVATLTVEYEYTGEHQPLPYDWDE